MNITDFNDLTLAVNRVRNLAVVIMHGKCTGLLSVMLTPQYERLFFCSLLGSTSGTPKRLCRYTSLASLFRTLSEKQQSMCSTVCMNDKTENDYAQKFISEAMPQSNVISRLQEEVRLLYEMNDGSTERPI